MGRRLPLGGTVLALALVAACGSLALAQPAPPPEAAGALDAAPTTRLDEDLRTRPGVYAAPDGSTLTLTGDNGAPRGFAYALASGTHGALREEADGTFAAPDFTLRFGLWGAAP